MLCTNQFHLGICVSIDSQHRSISFKVYNFIDATHQWVSFIQAGESAKILDQMELKILPHYPPDS